MNTFQHGFWLYFLMWRHHQVWQFVIGSMLPDYVYFVLLAVLFIKGIFTWYDLLTITPAVFMSYLPQYPWAIYVDLVGHSAVICAGMGLLTIFSPFKRWQAFIVGWGTHILIDGLTHAAHANFFLYPITLLAVHSPVSYWDPKYFAHEFRLVNGVLMLLAAGYLGYSWWKKHKK
ncbi:MAG: phospholipase nuclease [Firmicutes bacterium]|nr:phospholipase nuclease [Bacillota bacterium]